MVGQTLAASDIGESVGYVVGLLLLPGLLLLILGISRSRVSHPPQVPQAPPPYWQQSGPPGYPPGQYPPPQAGYYQQPPPPQPAKRSGGGMAMIVVGCVLVVLGVGGVGLAALGASNESAPVQSQPPNGARPSATSSPSGLAVGECITNSQYASANMSPDSADCTLPDAVYELAYEGAGPSATCPDGEREDSGYAVLLNNSHILCFVLNVSEGECFEVDPHAQMFNPVDCADPTANSKIDTIIEGFSDLSLCLGGARGAAFPEPARTYCVVPPS